MKCILLEKAFLYISLLPTMMTGNYNYYRINSQRNAAHICRQVKLETKKEERCDIVQFFIHCKNSTLLIFSRQQFLVYNSSEWKE